MIFLSVHPSKTFSFLVVFVVSSSPAFILYSLVLWSFGSPCSSCKFFLILPYSTFASLTSSLLSFSNSSSSNSPITSERPQSWIKSYDHEPAFIMGSTLQTALRKDNERNSQTKGQTDERMDKKENQL